MTKHHTSIAKCQIVFSRRGNEVFGREFEAATAKSLNAAFRDALPAFRRRCAGISIPDVTIQFRTRHMPADHSSDSV